MWKLSEKVSQIYDVATSILLKMYSSFLNDHLLQYEVFYVIMFMLLYFITNIYKYIIKK